MWLIYFENENEKTKTNQKILTIKLKTARKLFSHLPNSINKLQKNRSPLLIISISISMPVPLCKFMPKSQPVFFNKDLEPLDCSEMRTQHDLAESTDLQVIFGGKKG